jgi:hypothetical protein
MVWEERGSRSRLEIAARTAPAGRRKPMASVLVPRAGRVLTSSVVGFFEVRADGGKLCLRLRSPTPTADSRQVLADLGVHGFRVKKAAFVVNGIGRRPPEIKALAATIGYLLKKLLCVTIGAIDEHSP